MTRDELEEMRTDLQHVANALDALSTGYPHDDEMDAAVRVHEAMHPDRREELYGGSACLRALQPVTGEGLVYFARAVGTDMVKIGHTTADPEVRLASLRTGSHHALVIERVMPGSQADEHALHGQLFARRVRLEWFRLTTEEVTRIVDRVAIFHFTVGVCASCGAVDSLITNHRCYKCGGKSWA